MKKSMIGLVVALFSGACGGDSDAEAVCNRIGACAQATAAQIEECVDGAPDMDLSACTDCVTNTDNTCEELFEGVCDAECGDLN